MEYWPTLLVVTERVRSMSAGLEASTVTPGSTAPDASLTVPTMEPCAKALAGARTRHASTRIRCNDGCILLLRLRDRERSEAVYQKGCGGLKYRFRRI